MRRTVLFFGSFNPIHKGHTAVAEYVVREALCDNLWFVVSPQNPLKNDDTLIPDHHRLQMAQIAVQRMGLGAKVQVCDVEFGLPKPSYTIETLRVLQKRYLERSFSLLAGGDILKTLGHWKEARAILDNYPILIYPREGSDPTSYAVFAEHNIHFLKNAPTWNYSSTDIRNALQGGEDVTSMLDAGVYEYIKQNKLWMHAQDCNKK